MAPRVGLPGGADRPSYGAVRPSGGRASFRTVDGTSPNSGAAAAWGILANVTADLGEREHRRYDKQVAASSQQAGIRDALAGNVRALDRSTTRGAAYMDGALETVALTAETNALVAMQQLYAANPEDPKALSQGIEDYANGAVGPIESVDLATAVKLRSRIVTGAIPMINGAIEARERKSAEVRKNARVFAEAAEETTIAQHAAGIFSSDPGQSAASVQAITAARARSMSLLSEEAAEGFLLARLGTDKDASHIVNMKPELKTRLAKMLAEAPPEVGAGLGIYSGYRTIERQQELWDASDKTGKWVAPPGKSKHNHGNAGDLSWQGKSLKHAPENVQRWVKENAEKYGLAVPMAHEPWHIEVAEAREPKGAAGGAKAKADPGSPAFDKGGIFDVHDQAFYDNVVSRGYRSWFTSQPDKVGAYVDLIEGNTELPMHLPGGEVQMVKVRDRLSPKALSALQEDLRQEISFDNQQREAIEKRAAADVKQRSEAARAGYMTGILLHGTEIDQDGEKVKVQKPGADDLIKALQVGDLEPSDFEALSKALTVERPGISNQDLVRDATRQIFQGNDVQGLLLNRLDELSTADGERLLKLNETIVRDGGGFNDQQKFYFDRLRDQFKQSELGALDPNKQAREASALIEFRNRIQEGEPVADVYEDVSARSRAANEITFGTTGLVRPRFAVPDPANPDAIDPAQSFEALKLARDQNKITPAEYARQVRNLRVWTERQKADLAAPKGK